ncbi:uncharacterized protein [Nicotiana tomentosiformis]|uniref:uncharacterized protein n=1 Tax=Nicotiana tomentosiformis TaxID=4098 RepID=UPI00388CB904
MAHLTKRFQKMVRRNGSIPKRGSSSKPKNYDLCHKCGKPGHFIKDCPLLKQDQYKHSTDKAAKRNPVPDKRFKRKNAADNVVKQALAAWGDSSSESEEDDDQGDSSMMAVESKAAEYYSIFTLMAQSDDDEDDNDDDEVNFLDIQRNLKSYSLKKLMSLENVLINAYHSLINDKNALTLELGEAEQSRDDLVVVVVDLKETIESLKKENDVLTEKIANIKHERDNLVVVVVDLKETIECVKKEKKVLTEKVASIEHERDDLLVVVVDLKDTIEELKGEGRNEILQKGKEVADEIHLRLEDEIKSVKSSLCAELEKNKQLQEELGRVKSDLEKSLKWTWPYDAITSMYTNNGGNMQGIGFQREKTPYNPHSKYVTVPDNWLYTHCGNTRHFKETWSSEGEQPIMSGDLSCLSDVDDDAELWHRRLGHASFSLLNKLVKKDLVHGLPKSSFKDHKVCDACAKRKHVRSSFKHKKEVSTSRPLDLLHTDLCGSMRVPGRGGKRYIFVIVDDYSRFTWTLFLRTKDETFQVFVAFVKKIQVKMGNNVVCLRSDHGTEFDNAKFDEFCVENGITHNFSAPRTLQQNGVMERKNRTLEDMARTTLIDSGIAKGFRA